jgi:hypothetical protein
MKESSEDASFQGWLEKYTFIEKIEDLSDDFITRMRIVFKNNKQLSIVKGFSTYGNNQGLFEIAPFNENEEMDGSLFDEEDKGDNVLGYCDVEKVYYYIKKIGLLK